MFTPASVMSSMDQLNRASASVRKTMPNTGARTSSSWARAKSPQHPRGHIVCDDGHEKEKHPADQDHRRAASRNRPRDVMLRVHHLQNVCQESQDRYGGEVLQDRDRSGG